MSDLDTEKKTEDQEDSKVDAMAALLIIVCLTVQCISGYQVNKIKTWM